MTKAAGLIIDKEKAITERLKKIDPASYKRWILVPLFYKEEAIAGIELYLKRQGCSVEKIQLKKEMREASFLLRDIYINFIYEISEKKFDNQTSLKSIFKVPGSNYSLWWPSLVAEKNTVKSTAFCNLVKVYSIIEQIRQRGIRTAFLYLENKAVSDSLLAWGKENNIKFVNIMPRWGIAKNLLFFYLRAMRSLLIYLPRVAAIKKRMHKTFNQRINKLKDLEYLLLTYFPLIDFAAIKKEEFINLLYKPIHQALKRQRLPYAWGANIVNYAGYNLDQSIELGRDINAWNETLFFWDEFLKFKDLILVTLTFHWVALKYFFCRRKIRALLSLKKNEITINAWHLLSQDFDDSFCGSVLMFNLIYYRLFKGIFNLVNRKAMVLYPAEMQGWEKSLCAAAIESGITKTVAVQHAAMPKFLLNYYFNRNEIVSKFTEAGMPKPDRLACVGGIAKGLLNESGWQEDQVFVLGGIRFNHYLELFSKKIIWQEKRNAIIVALSISPREAKEVISICLDAFNKKEGLAVIFKGHPCNPVLPLLEELKIGSLRPPFFISDTPLSDLLSEAKIIIVTESSATLEGLACHCQIIIPQLVGAVDLNPLTGLTDLAMYVGSSDELYNAADNILKNNNPPYPRDTAIDFLNQYITFRSDDREFLESIDRQFA